MPPAIADRPLEASKREGMNMNILETNNQTSPIGHGFAPLRIDRRKNSHSRAGRPARRFWAHRAGWALVVLGLPLLVFGAESLRWRRVPIEIAELGTVEGYAFGLGAKEYQMLPPPKWFVRINEAERKIDLGPGDNNVHVSITLLLQPVSGTPELKAEQLKKELQERLPKARIIEEFECHSGVASGPAFDLEDISETGFRRMLRVFFMPLPGYRVECTLISTPAYFKQAQMTFGNLMTSFRPVEPPAPKP